MWHPFKKKKEDVESRTKLIESIKRRGETVDRVLDKVSNAISDRRINVVPEFLPERRGHGG